MEHPDTFLPTLERASNDTLLTRAKQVIGRVGLALALTVGGAVSTATTYEAVTASQHVAAADTNYPWDDAVHVPQPPAKDKITWGFTDKSNCDNKSQNYDCSSYKVDSYYIRDQWGYDLRNCTSYVAWRIAKEFGVSVAGWHNAESWADNAAKAGYTVDTSPEPGDIAQWTSRDHVAFVESVNPDGSVNVSQYNRRLDGQGTTENNVRADHYIDINGTGNIWNGASANNNAGPAPNTASFDSVGEQEELTDGSWVYTKVGGSAWPIKPKSQWTQNDTSYWGNDPKMVSSDDVHNHEVGYDTNGRNIGAHPPRDGTELYVDGGTAPQQYYFFNGKAYEVVGADIDDLHVRDKAEPVPATGDRLNDFLLNREMQLPVGTIYRFAGTSRVNQMILHPDGSYEAYNVNNDTAESCLHLVQHRPTIILPQSARYFMEDALNIPEIATPVVCSFPSGMTLIGPGGIEQWRITGNNVTEPYVRHYYPTPLLTYLHTSGHPDLETLDTVAAINDLPRGEDMAVPEGLFFRDTGNGGVFESTGGAYHPIPWPDMLNCLGNPSIVDVPSQAMIALPQAEPISCRYENRVVVRPDGRAYYVSAEKLYYIANPAVRDCIVVRDGTGPPTLTSDQDVNTYLDSGQLAHCPYEKDPGLNFVREDNDPSVWLVHPDGTKQHVTSLCVPDAATTDIKKFHEFVVRPGETAGHVQTAEWSANSQLCDALPG